MIKRFNSNLFYASDLEKTARFYEQLGFTPEKLEEVVRIKLGDFTLAFVDKDKTPIQKEANAEPKGLGFFVYVEVEDVDIYFQSLKQKGVHASSEPRDWPWGKREFVVKDPDGYKLVFYSPIKK
ncbi:VOC family protein [Candidatus Parcubacteria bacterium]|nr:MAG: VOC family protein [Candidatus Parcubacteria bacterium]